MPAHNQSKSLINFQASQCINIDTEMDIVKSQDSNSQFNKQYEFSKSFNTQNIAPRKDQSTQFNNLSPDKLQKGVSSPKSSKLSKKYDK